MKEITILSGKGGTGKTTFTAALGSIVPEAVFCDSDVDASNLHIIFNPEFAETHIYEGAWKAEINTEKCLKCQRCINFCRFNAIEIIESGEIQINPFRCEGCRLCERVCPASAILSERSANSKWFVSKTRFGIMVHAIMGAGEENSGKLVTVIRNKAKNIADSMQARYIINDGPPGIGCPVISSLTGTNAAIVVLEPTQSSLHDAKRIFSLIRDFKISAFAIINKTDISDVIARDIKSYLETQNIPLLGNISYHPEVVKAQMDGKNIVEFDENSQVSLQIQKIWDKFLQITS